MCKVKERDNQSQADNLEYYRNLRDVVNAKSQVIKNKKSA